MIGFNDYDHPFTNLQPQPQTLQNSNHIVQIKDFLQQHKQNLPQNPFHKRHFRKYTQSLSSQQQSLGFYMASISESQQCELNKIERIFNHLFRSLQIQRNKTKELVKKTFSLYRLKIQNWFYDDSQIKKNQSYHILEEVKCIKVCLNEKKLEDLQLILNKVVKLQSKQQNHRLKENCQGSFSTQQKTRQQSPKDKIFQRKQSIYTTVLNKRKKLM